ncbi:MAG: hypothetical protein RL653_1480 [Pseudomonadota bacterium]
MGEETRVDMKQRVAALGLPAEVASRFAVDMEALVSAGGASVRALLVYGSAARGRYRPGHSDLNVVVVLADAAPGTLDRISGPLQQATRHVGLEPFLLVAGEIPRAADVFPTKFADIVAHHVLLSGEDPFSELVIPHAHLRLRVEQELRNLCLRLRRRYVGLRADPHRLAEAFAEVLPGLCIELGMLLRLAKRPVPAGDDPKQVLAAAAPMLGLDPAELAGVAELPTAEPEAVHRKAHLVLEALARASEVADEAEERAAG